VKDIEDLLRQEIWRSWHAELGFGVFCDKNSIISWLFGLSGKSKLLMTSIVTLTGRSPRLTGILQYLGMFSMICTICGGHAFSRSSGGAKSEGLATVKTW